jgi:hypothetical protein
MTRVTDEDLNRLNGVVSLFPSPEAHVAFDQMRAELFALRKFAAAATRFIDSANLRYELLRALKEVRQ